MTILPNHQTVVCKEVSPSEVNVTTNGITVTEKRIPVYEIIYLDCSTSMFKIGDRVYSCSTGDKIKFDDDFVYVFKLENIMAKEV